MIARTLSPVARGTVMCGPQQSQFANGTDSCSILVTGDDLAEAARAVALGSCESTHAHVSARATPVMAAEDAFTISSTAVQAECARLLMTSLMLGSATNQRLGFVDCTHLELGHG